MTSRKNLPRDEYIVFVGKWSNSSSLPLEVLNQSEGVTRWKIPCLFVLFVQTESAIEQPMLDEYNGDFIGQMQSHSQQQHYLRSDKA